MGWHKFPVSLRELCIDTTLRCGQSFRWKKLPDDSYNCAIHGRLISLRQDATHLHYRAIRASRKKRRTVPLTPDTHGRAAVESEEENEQEVENTRAFLQHYLNLGPNLSALYEEWSTADANFKKKAPRFAGIRILRQDAWEALVGFICSSNNNIPRISQMMEKLCINYGALIGYIDSQAFYDMPPPEALTGPDVEANLRQLGFGYRAKYIYKTAVMITEEGEGWLDSLRNPESPLLGQKPKDAGELLEGGRDGYRNAHEELLTLQGVGPKVADCVCLMGLGWGEAVPVDTHVWNIACRDYKFGRGKHASLNKQVYGAIGNHFRTLWGKEAGWAHSVLFTADLRAFSERLHAEVEVKEDTIIDEDDERIKREAAVKVELLPAIAADDGGIERPLIKAERTVHTASKRVGKREIKLESPALKKEFKEDVHEEPVKKEEDRGRGRVKREAPFLKDEDIKLPSIEQDGIAFKEETNDPASSSKRETKLESQTPVKKELSATDLTPLTGERRLPSRSVKHESHTPTKKGLRSIPYTAPSPSSESGSYEQEEGQTSAENGVSFRGTAQELVKTEILPTLGVKREAEQEERNPSESRASVPMRRSKRQRLGGS